MISVNTGSRETDALLEALVARLRLPADADMFICAIDNRAQRDAAMKIIVCDASERENVERDCGDGEYVLTRPVSFAEFENTVSSLRVIPHSDRQSFSFDRETGVVTRGEKSVRLTPKERELFAYLLAHRRNAVSRETLRRALWSDSEKSNAPDVYISYLRAKLRELFGDGVIVNERGAGYLLRDIDLPE